MSCLHVPMPKKLKQLPASSKKAWKAFTSSIHPKLRHLRNHLEIPTSVTTAAARRLLHLRPRRRPRRMGRQQYYQYRHLQQQQCSSVPASPATVHVDRLFEESSKPQSTGPTTRGVYVSSLPTIGGVDERAEEFISKFRQEMQLQREESILEFQQMLARSA